MIHEIKLKNVIGQNLLLDEKGYKAIKADKYLSSIKFLDNLRAYSKSGGYPFYSQVKKENGKKKPEVIYVHHWLAAKFLKKPEGSQKLYLRCKNGNRLDCRIENLHYSTASDMVKNGNRPKTRIALRGVTRENGRYRANFYLKGTDYFLGYFDTPEEAAEAWNKKAAEMKMETEKLSRIQHWIFNPEPIENKFKKKAAKNVRS